MIAGLVIAGVAGCAASPVAPLAMPAPDTLTDRLATTLAAELHGHTLPSQGVVSCPHPSVPRTCACTAIAARIEALGVQVAIGLTDGPDPGFFVGTGEEDSGSPYVAFTRAQDRSGVLVIARPEATLIQHDADWDREVLGSDDSPGALLGALVARELAAASETDPVRRGTGRVECDWLEGCELCETVAGVLEDGASTSSRTPRAES